MGANPEYIGCHQTCRRCWLFVLSFRCCLHACDALSFHVVQGTHANAGLDAAKTTRNLRDLFTQYGPYQDGELPWVRTQCVVDSVQASAYLVQAVVFLYRAIDYQGLECPKNTPSGCAVSVAGFIASLSWVASYISLAASSCGDAVNSGALCAADWTALMADFAEVASSGAAVKNDCDFGGKISALLLHIDRNRKTHPYYHWEQFLPAGAGPAVIMARKRHVPFPATRFHKS